MKTKPKPKSPAPELAATLQAELAWLATVIDTRFRTYFQGAADPLPPPPEIGAATVYGQFLARVQAAGPAERLLLVLALAPHLAPQLLDVFYVKHEKIERGFTEFGGAKGTWHAGFLPTGETALFLLAGRDLAARLRAIDRFDSGHALFLQGPLRLGTAPADEPAWSGILSFAPSALRQLLAGSAVKPEPEASFPARAVTTELGWDDLVVKPSALAGLEEIHAWVSHESLLLENWRLKRRLKRGYRALFHGPSGTGKTLAATLLGQRLGREVQRIDLSQVVSKFIGETEKNLAAVFTAAAQQDWILFFDEADALFGKRTATASSHDRYANQEVAYLLQRVEDHPGLVILATNLKSNLDEAFARRFQISIHFAPPDATQRERLWRESFGRHVPLSPAVDFRRIAEAYDLTGGQIINVVRHAAIMAAKHGTPVQPAALDAGCRRELQAVGRTV
jgi:hypothetical protein